MIQVASQQQMKRINAKSVFRLIRASQGIPRVQLAKLTRLSRTTISFIVDDLIRKELVVERAVTGTAGVGRPAVILEVNDAGKYVIAVELNTAGVSGTVYNLKNEPVIRATHELPLREADDEQWLAGITGVIRQLKLAAENRFKTGVAICIAVPAVLDAERKSMIASSLFKLQRMDMHNRLEREFADIPIHIENETLLAAMAERESDLGDSSPSPFIYVSVNDGVGASVMIGDKALEGANRTFLEMGHMSLDIHGDPCPCGNRGCFELHVSTQAMILKVNANLPAYPASLIHDLIRSSGDQIDEQLVKQAAEAGDPLALRVIGEIGDNLGYGLVNLIHIFNPAKIVIGGRLAVLGERLLAPARQRVAERALHAFADRCELALSARTGNGSSLGASIHAWNQIMDALIE